MASMIAVSNSSSNYRKHLESPSREGFLETVDNTNNRIDSQDDEPHVHVFSEFPEMLISKLNDQRRCSSMCDVTIITQDGRSFRAHKAVLAATSRYLESELSALNDETMNSKTEAVINLGMISSGSFETLLDLVYTAKLTLTKQNVADVLLAAEVLDLKKVGTICRKFLRSQITSKSVKCGLVCSDSSDSPQYDMNNNDLRKNMDQEFTDTLDNAPENLITQPDQIEQDDLDQPFVRKEFQKRPSSLSEPTQSTESGYESRSASVPIQSKSPPLSNRSSPIQHDGSLLCPDGVPELIDVTTLDPNEKDSISRSEMNRLDINNERFRNCDDNCRPHYKVKSEVKIVPEYFPQYRYPTASTSMKNFSTFENESSSLPNAQPRFEISTQNGSRIFEPFSKRVAEPLTRGTPLVIPSNRRSFDSAVGSYTNFVDLNATPMRKKARSDDNSMLQNANSRQLERSMHGRYSNAPSFLASLYMLQSRAYNPINFLNANYSANPMHYPKRQLQHSKSIVSSNGHLCKLCRFEFTSEWSLSMHYHLCHPVNYYSASQPTSPTNQSSPEKKNDDELPQIPNAPSKPSLLTRSTSSPAGVDVRKSNPTETVESPNDMKKNNADKSSHRCYYCKKEFSSIYLLRKHKSTEHLKRPFRCHRCESAFPNKAGLSVHLRSHTGERPYRCNVCDKAFTQLGHVQRHQKVHTGEKPYECPYCHARVRDKASMNYHILAHQGVKPFQCDQCDARFTKRSSLVKHKNVHTGSFLYQCPQCKASFREKASLSRHVRSQHKEPYFSVSSEFVATNTVIEKDNSVELSKKSQNTPIDMCLGQSTDEIAVV